MALKHWSGFAANGMMKASWSMRLAQSSYEILTFAYLHKHYTEGDTNTQVVPVSILDREDDKG